MESIENEKIELRDKYYDDLTGWVERTEDINNLLSGFDRGFNDCSAIMERKISESIELIVDEIISRPLEYMGWDDDLNPLTLTKEKLMVFANKLITKIKAA